MRGLETFSLIERQIYLDHSTHSRVLNTYNTEHIIKLLRGSVDEEQTKTLLLLGKKEFVISQRSSPIYRIPLSKTVLLTLNCQSRLLTQCSVIQYQEWTHCFTALLQLLFIFFRIQYRTRINLSVPVDVYISIYVIIRNKIIFYLCKDHTNTTYL